MKQFLTFFIAISTCVLALAQQNVGIGVLDPASRLHIHKGGGYYSALQITNQATDSLEGDGLLFAIGDAGEAYITNTEDENLSFGTNGSSRLNILADGSIGINTISMLGSADFMLKSDNPTSYGGMSVQHTNETNGRPFYGYIVGEDIKGWHYFDQASDTWRLNVSGDKMAVTSSGRVGIGTVNPHSSAILDIKSSNKGVLLPRMSTTNRNNINSPAEGLMVYDSTLKENHLFDGTDWKTMGGESFWQSHANGVIYDGRVGIGPNIAAISKLTVTGSSTTGVRARSTYNGASTQYLTDSRLGASGTGNRYATFSQVASNASTGTSYGVFGQAIVVNPTEPNYGVYGQILGITGTTAYAIYGEGFEANHLAGYFRGEVRIGNNAGPTGTIRIDPNGQSSAAVIEMFDNDGDRSFLLRGNENTSEGSDMLMYNEEEEMTIQLDADAAGNGHGAIEVYDADGVKTVSIIGAETSNQGASVFLRNALNQTTIELDADIGGKGRVITEELQITGGADLAEYFKSTEANLTPGSVVVIDPNNPAGIKLATNYQDKAVVGVISGANGIDPGMTMGQQGTEAFGDHPVAIVGRVYVRIDGSRGEVLPGDFLTTSDDPGKACKVRKLKRAAGAIIGKALTATDENGYALILIQLQ